MREMVPRYGSNSVHPKMRLDPRGFLDGKAEKWSCDGDEIMKVGSLARGFNLVHHSQVHDMLH